VNKDLYIHTFISAECNVYIFSSVSASAETFQVMFDGCITQMKISFASYPAGVPSFSVLG